MSTKNLVLVVTILFLSFTQVASVRAACNPAECGEPKLDCTGSNQCLAKCCVAPGGGGGGVVVGPGGFSCDWNQFNCLPGYVKDTTGGYSDFCGSITGCPKPGSAQDRIAPGCGGTYCGDQKCTINKNGVEKCKCLQWNYRRQTIRTYGCVPTAPVCTPASPTAPTLSSPANGASLVDIAVDLIWNSTNFGTACTAPYSQYQIYLDQNNPPTTLIGTVAGGGKV